MLRSISEPREEGEITMHRYEVPRMSCGHCAGAIEKAVKALDAGAEIRIDLPAREVRVVSDRERQAIGDAIRSAGYENTALEG